MKDGKRFLAIIPARSGSKRLPRKNLLPLQGVPLVAWTLQAAKRSRSLDKVILSTDSPEIAGVAKSMGLEVPFLRPAHLATDTASAEDVVKHALDSCAERYDYLVLLQPTSPLRTEKEIEQAIEMAVKQNAPAVVSVSPTPQRPEWTFSLSANQIPNEALRSIRAPSEPGPFYRLNGAIYVCRVDVFLQQNSLFPTGGVHAISLPESMSVDIDTQSDFDWAEYLLNHAQIASPAA